MSNTKIPNGVLGFSAPPPDPMPPVHSTSWATMYERLNIVAHTEAQNPTTFTGEKVFVFIFHQTQTRRSGPLVEKLDVKMYGSFPAEIEGRLACRL